MALQININWQQLEKIPLKIKVAVVVGLCSLIAGLFFYFAYLPQKKVLAQLNGQLETAERAYNEKKAIADNLPTFQEEVRRLNERLSIALTKLPNTAEIDKILVDVPNLAKEEELTVATFQPGTETPRDFYSAISLKLSLKGPYNRLAKFFEKVSRLNRIISIGDISLSPGSKRADGATILTAEVSAQTYTFSEKPKESKDTKAKGKVKK